MSVLPKIQALIARAAHPETPVEEARTSAVIAAKLILEHEVVLTEKGGQRLPIFSEQSYPRPYNPFDFLEVLFEEIRRGGPRGAYGRARPGGPPPPPPPPPKKKARGPRTRRKKPPTPPPFETEKCPHGFAKSFCSECGGVPPTRTVYTALCPSSARDIWCACCRTPIRPGQRMAWVGDDRIHPNFTPLTHDGCIQHWQRDWCVLCGKKTT